MNIPVRRGMLLRHQGRYYFVDELVEHRSAKQKPTVHVTLRDALDGRHVERTVDDLMPLDEAAGVTRSLQYLYHRDNAHVFMDSETFEEIELYEPQLAGSQPFLKEGELFRVFFAGDQPLRLDLPEVVVLSVAMTAAPAHAVGAAASVLKEATLENGLMVRVPMFIKTGDAIRIDTRTRTYIGRAGA
ncbi:MAG: hypothetical protein AB7Q17_01905 [Phycisphaerae bacterium]